MKALLLTLLFSLSALGQSYDIVLEGGRVMDPETGLDAVRNVAISGDRIVEISAEPLQGTQSIDVSGLVVAPGFIDLHAHGQTNEANEYQARDGVTTALELESGRPFLREWIKHRTGNAMINFGATSSHPTARTMAMAKYAPQVNEIVRLVAEEGLESENLEEPNMAMAGARYESVKPEEMDRMIELLQDDLDAGALGIGIPVGYYPGAKRSEMFKVFEFAAEKGTVMYSHVREISVDAIQEAIANAAATGAALHIVHLNSISLGEIGTTLEMVRSAQERGLDITTEVYPYTAASTGLETTLFDEGWQQRFGIDYGDLQWEATGERLNEKTFAKYREEGGTVIIHLMKPEWIEMGIQAPFVMIGSDGMPYAPGAHPRSAGTFSRVLGKYVREDNVISLMEALSKMTIMPAKRLETVSPAASRKGRVQVGADADITVFDPDTIIDTATFEEDLSFSIGVRHVLVNGELVVRDGQTVAGARPGRALLGRSRR